MHRSSYACPASDTGVVVSTELLRSHRFEGTRLRAGAGTTFGTVQNALYAANRTLGSNWHRGVTLGGAVATSVQHLGVGIAELVVELTLLTSNGSLVTLTPANDAFAYVFGSVGMLGVVVEVVLETEPRSTFEWESSKLAWSDDEALVALARAWVVNNTRQSVLWLLPSLQKGVLQAMSRGTVEVARQTAYLPSTYLPKHRYALPGLTLAAYLNLWSLAVALAEPLLSVVMGSVVAREMERAVDEYVRAEVSLPHLPISPAAEHENDQDLLPTRLATVELGFSVASDALPPCVVALARAPYEVALHIRFAQRLALPLVASGANVVHLDLSVPEALLPQLASWLDDAANACPPVAASEGHAGKLSLGDAAARRAWTTPLPPQRLPGSSTSDAHTHFRALVAQWDAHGKFRPSSREFDPVLIQT